MTTAPIHNIEGEPFEMRVVPGGVVLRHATWEAVWGEGSTLLEAEMDVKHRAREIAPAYVHHPDAQLTRRAFEMKTWLLRILV